ncbi:hypothetical protein GGR51DRAFT_572095 [Nemania sp. FL0031]|nr:hypothetical protein GGR51DRAFT_572095 [Nemania sp. FL0031]
MRFLVTKPNPQDLEPVAASTISQATERMPPSAIPPATVPLSPVNPDGVRKLAVAFDQTPSDAVAAGIEADILGFEEVTLSEIHSEVFKLNGKGHRLEALRHALNHACKWAFITGYKSRFNARVGLLPAGSGHPQYLAIFLSFNLIPAPTYGTANPKNINVAGTGPYTVNPSGLAPPATILAAQPTNKTEVKGMSQDTKYWIAERILRLLLRIYGDVTFPRRIWFMEDEEAGKPASLLMPYSMGAPGSGTLQRSTDKAYNRIVMQINNSTVSDDLSKEEGIKEEEDAGIPMVYEDMDMGGED